MDMDEMSAEELEDLESRLYSQVHHGTDSDLIDVYDAENVDELKNTTVVQTTENIQENILNDDATDENPKESCSEVAEVANLPDLKTEKLESPKTYTLKPFQVRLKRLCTTQIANINANIKSNKRALKSEKKNDMEANSIEKKKRKAETLVAMISLDSSSDACDDDGDGDGDGDEDEDEDEVVIIPTPPTPVITLDDTDDELTNDTEVIDKAAVCADDSVASLDDFISPEDRKLLKQPNVSNFEEHLISGINANIVSDDSDVEYCSVTKTACDKDLDDGIYSRGKKKSIKTIIRNLETSSEDEAETEEQGHKIKDISSDKSGNTTDFEADLDTGVTATPLRGVSRGIAVEHRATEKSRKKLSKQNVAVNAKKKSRVLINKPETIDDDSDNSESSALKAPTAREIVKAALSEKKTSEDNGNDNDNEAIPESMCIALQSAFKKIEEMGRNTEERRRNRTTEHPAFHNLPLENNVPQEKVYEMPKNITSWNTEMYHFYNSSWDDEKFLARNVWHGMNSNDAIWTIDNADRFAKKVNRSNLKCHNCTEQGHIAVTCKMPKKELICNTCGCKGHREARCPNALCLRCGQPSQQFLPSCNRCLFQNRVICPLCKVRGHAPNDCPDHWRRYHSTTELKLPLVTEIKYNNRVFCSVCSCSDHRADKCSLASEILDYPADLSHIVSHSHIYDDQAYFDVSTPTIQNYDPNDVIDDSIRFKYTQSTSNKGFLYRFRKNNGLLHFNDEDDKAVDDKAVEDKTAEDKTADDEAADNKPVEEKPVEDKPVEDKPVDDIIVLDDKAVKDETTNGNVISNDAENSTEEAHCSRSNDKIAAEIPEAQQISKKRSIDFKNLPEIIKIGSSISDDTINPNEDLREPTGISNCFRDTGPYEMKQLPEEKIFLSEIDGQYLLTSNNCRYLEETAKAWKVSYNMTVIQNSYILKYRGLPENMCVFYNRITYTLKKMNKEKSSGWKRNTTPKRVEVAIAHLRTAFKKLLEDHGNVNEIYIKYKIENENYTYAAQVKANLLRRQLNIILLGQAQLGLGQYALDILIKSLTTLLNSYKRDEHVSVQLRETIQKTYTLIFEPFDHINYDDMIKVYWKKPTKQIVDIPPALFADQMQQNRGISELNPNKRKLGDVEMEQQQQGQQAEIPCTTTAMSLGQRLQKQQQQPQLQLQLLKHKQHRDDEPSVYWSKRILDMINANVRCLNVNTVAQIKVIQQKAQSGNISKNEYHALVVPQL